MMVPIYAIGMCAPPLILQSYIAMHSSAFNPLTPSSFTALTATNPSNRNQVMHQPHLARAGNFRGRQAIFISWVTTAPFVTSFVEETDPGTAKTTRENTLLNRVSSPSQSQKRPRPKSSSTLPSLSTASLDSSSSTSSSSMGKREKKAISFADTVHVYSDDFKARPTMEKVKYRANARLKSGRISVKGLHNNPSTPTTAAGKWLLSKSSSEDSQSRRRLS